MTWRLKPRRITGKCLAVLVLGTIGVTSCGQNYNSDSNDAGGDIGIDCSTNASLCAAYTVIQNNHCFECHSWSGYKTNAAWVSAGLVVADDPTDSMIIKQLKNSGGTMPQNYTPLLSSDYNSLVSWIQNL
jgi:hypothetical protein